MRQTFKKRERLRGKTTIDRLFVQGKSFFYYPFIIQYSLAPATEEHSVCAVLFSVSKKKVRHAVQRNLLKRLFREAYRKNKEGVYRVIESKKTNLHLAFIYLKREPCDYTFMEKKVTEALNKLITELVTQSECE